AQVDEDHPAVVAPPVYPAGNGDFLAGQGLVDLAAIMAAHRIDPKSGKWAGKIRLRSILVLRPSRDPRRGKQTMNAQLKAGDAGTFRLLIGGKLVPGASTFDVINPATEQVFSPCPRADLNQLN